MKDETEYECPSDIRKGDLIGSLSGPGGCVPNVNFDGHVAFDDPFQITPGQWSLAVLYPNPNSNGTPHVAIHPLRMWVKANVPDRVWDAMLNNQPVAKPEPIEHPAMIDRDGDRWIWFEGKYWMLDTHRSLRELEESWGPIRDA